MPKTPSKRDGLNNDEVIIKTPKGFSSPVRTTSTSSEVCEIEDFKANKESSSQAIYIGLGSSIGNAEEIFKSTEKYLEKYNLKVIKKSSNHRTEPWGGIAQNTFTNAVWQIETLSTSFAQRPYKKALQLLKILQDCEKAHGRDRNTELHWGDRPLDIDILWFQGLCCHNKKLKIPHPYMLEREFVMQPLEEIL